MTRRGYLDGAQATLGDLRKREYLRVKCGNCHHAGFVLPRDTPHIPNDTKLIDLPMLRQRHIRVDLTAAMLDRALHAASGICFGLTASASLTNTDLWQSSDEGRARVRG